MKSTVNSSAMPALGGPFFKVTANTARKRHDAVVDGHGDFARVNAWLEGEFVDDILVKLCIGFVAHG
jgi:hypothetical protein